ncbi:MAG: hypothetical protein Q8J68_09340 [Methanolobus sp.]|uniref:hypothetical protein n=1 Tax=Methanolobus sp. TaxID=1874737 RepID=UPI00272F0163|nr:hypothetical protein [Methanolobus sp.]MDP2217477.1 hypothetical protein [Methanolobus sp.]
MTDLSAVEISLEECRRYVARAERALESLKAGKDNNSYTAAMKKSSSDLSDVLVVVRGDHKETKSRHLVKRNETVAQNEIVAPSGTHPDPNQFLCSECGCLVDLHKMISPDLTEGQKVCESCFHSDAYKARTIDKFIQSLPLRTCFKCGQKFHSENPYKWKGEIHCDDCFHMVSREKDELLPEPERKPTKYEPVSGAWKNTPGTSNGRYRCLEDEVIELAYGTCSPVKTSWAEMWELADTENNLAKEIIPLLGEARSTNRITAVRSFVKAVRAGKIPESPAGDA